MRKTAFIIFLLLFILNLSYSQDNKGCILQGSLYSDSSEIVIGLPFVLFVRDNGVSGCQLYLQYPTQTGNPRPVKPAVIMRLLDTYSDITDQAGTAMVPFTQNSTNFSVNRDWVEAVYEGPSSKAIIVIRDGRTRFLTDESYTTIKNRFIVCPPTDSRDTVCADNGLNVAVDNSCVEIGGTMQRTTTTVNLNGKILSWTGSRFGEGLEMNDGIDNYRLGTGNGSTTEDAYTNWYRDIDGFGRMTMAAYQILIGVPAGNGYHLPNVRPGNNPETFPYYAKWYPVWTRSGSGTGSVAGWELIEQDRKGIFTGTVDGSGDVTITISSVMPDASYVALVTPEGSTPYSVSVHTKTDASFKVATGLSAGTSVTMSWRVEDN